MARDRKTEPPTTLRTALMSRVARAGGNPRRLPSALPRDPAQPAQAPSSGRFNARGRGAKIAITFPRGPRSSADRGVGVQPRRIAVKIRIVKARGKPSGVKAHLRYLERDGVNGNGEPGRLYSTFTDESDRDAFIERGVNDRHQFRIILSPEDGAACEDLKRFARDVMAQMEIDLATMLDWVGVDHHDTGHPHVHIVLRGVTEDGKVLNIAGNYLSYGIRHRAGEVLARDLGPRTGHAVQRHLEHEVEAERLTSLDRTLIGRTDDGVVDLRLDRRATVFERTRRQLLIARARRLERMQLATREGPLRWSLSREAEEVLRMMGGRGDIIQTMHRAITQAGLGRSPLLYTIHDGHAAPVVGCVVAAGLADDEGGRRYLVIDGIDGRSHYADIGEAGGSFPSGSIVRLSCRSTEPRPVDRTIAAIAAAHGRHYSIDIHLRYDPAASEAFATTHVRRLEAIRLATGAVEREGDGTWTIAPDHLDRVRHYERHLSQKRPLTVETLSILPIERQVGAEGATWLDRQLTREVSHERADYGFGRDVHQALFRRQQWLVEQGLMQRDGSDVLFRDDLLKVLEQRELRQAGGQIAVRIGKTFLDPLPGIRVDGVYRQAIDLASGRFAVIEKAEEFTLVPWRPVLERHLGRSVSGKPRGDDFDWTIGRERDGPSL